MPDSPSNDQRLAEIARRLTAAQHLYEVRRDSRCVFTYAYALTTKTLKEALPTAGFQNPTWVVELAESFAFRYFAALDEYDAGRSASKAWKAALDAVVGTRSSVLEDLVFLITAHIVHDLPFALVDVGIDGAARLYDHDKINDVLGKEIDLIRDRVTRRYSPGLRWLDRIEKQYDQIATDYGIRMSRGLAWYNAMRLREPTTRSNAEDAIELSPQFLIGQVRHPRLRSIALLFSILRAVAALFRRWPRS